MLRVAEAVVSGLLVKIATLGWLDGSLEAFVFMNNALDCWNFS